MSSTPTTPSTPTGNRETPQHTDNAARTTDLNAAAKKTTTPVPPQK